MDSNQIRSKFLEFFEKNGHKIVASDLLVPKNDPSVLFTSAGMNQFKEQFMGKVSEFRRAASCQKCLRTADLENVGKSATHHTFFEMLGNFSFGDYFKKEAITWAWQFVTEVLKLPKDHLWISVHEEDSEAYEIWANIIGIDAARIVKLGDKENFWPANARLCGPNGPCGPCSEIFYDWSQRYGCKRSDCNPACSCGRFTEIWNLVFTQYDRQPDGRLAPLPTKNIDTGMGLERVATVMQNVRENYLNDLFTPITEALKQELSRLNVTPKPEWLDTNAKTVVDHIRAAAFAICDGVTPSNEERGYVIRKLIRRSLINLKQTGVEKPFCYKLVFSIAQVMKTAYPELDRRHEMIAAIIKKEEEAFYLILTERAGQNEMKFKEYAENKEKFLSAAITTANIAFTEYDTYGVPLEISKENAKKFGLDISDSDFEKEMDEQRNRSRSRTQLSGQIFAKTVSQAVSGVCSEFVGYEYCEYQAKVIAIVKDGSLVSEAKENEKVEIILDKTPFYAQAGGQTADRGVISKENFLAEVTDVVRVDEAILHSVVVKHGSLKKDETVLADVGRDLRLACARNHTATHLLQYALRNVLGIHIEQSGSLVTPEKLRFDFTHITQIPKEILKNIEHSVNKTIWQDLPVETKILNLDEAKEEGALAFFNEKYGQKVRVVSVKNTSKELCGGTHVNRTGQIGMFKIVSESSIAQGVRRIEAVTAEAAFSFLQNNDELLSTVGSVLKASPDKILTTLIKLSEQIKAQERELKNLKLAALGEHSEKFIKAAKKIQGINVVIGESEYEEVEFLRKITDLIKEKADPVISVLVGAQKDKPLLLVGISSSLAKKGVDAVAIIQEINQACGGKGGGGKKELAQAGLVDINMKTQVLAKAFNIIKTKFLKR
ncbi:MAG: alanine--tRNA ligase [Candidatus Omnitrophica bacterium]|nr:alanine--tRNA ligase [Candidatus Omnitrophota bacterium]